MGYGVSVGPAHQSAMFMLLQHMCVRCRLNKLPLSFCLLQQHRKTSSMHDNTKDSEQKMFNHAMYLMGSVLLAAAAVG